MKTKINLLVVTIIITLIVSSCKKDDNSTPSNNNNTTMASIITAGSWRVSYFHDGPDDHTSNFTGYSFTFSNNGTMTATNAGGTTNGTWSMDDSKNEFNITLSNADPLKDLSHGWTVISKTSTDIVLKDDNATHNEELHFTKI
jgi:hypothetical protein